MSKTKQQLWTKFGGKGFFARMAENAKNDGEGNEISQTYATKDTATSSTAGLMSGADKAKLDATGQGAEANVIESISANGVNLQVSDKNVDIPVATDQADGLLPHEKLALIPAAAQPGDDRVYSFDDANGTSWQTVVKDYIGDLLLDQEGIPVAGEDGNLLYSEDSVQLWLSYKGTEFGARRAYEDHTGENIHESIAAKPSMAQVNTAIEAALANYGGFRIVNIGQDGKPAVQDPSTKYIYLTKDEHSQAEDPYTEWIYTDNGQWEKIGETSVGIMTGATAQSDGASGIVPAPAIADRDKYLKGDGTWSTINIAEQKVDILTKTSGLTTDDFDTAWNAIANGHIIGIWYSISNIPYLFLMDKYYTYVTGENRIVFSHVRNPVVMENQYEGIVRDVLTWRRNNTSMTLSTITIIPSSLNQHNKFLFTSGYETSTPEWRSIKELPSSTSSDSGKVLKVNQSGNAEWAEAGSGLPDPTESDSLLLGQSDGSKAWNALSRDVMGTPLLDESNRPILDENSNPVYDANSTTDLWTSFAGHEFGARRAYADQEGNNIKATYATKNDLDTALGNIETLLAAL